MTDHDMIGSLFVPKQSEHNQTQNQQPTLSPTLNTLRSPFICTKSCPPPVKPTPLDQPIKNEFTDLSTTYDQQFWADLGITPSTPGFPSLPKSARPSISFPSFPPTSRPSISIPSGQHRPSISFPPLNFPLSALPESSYPRFSFSLLQNSGNAPAGLFGSVQDHTTLTLGMMQYIVQVELQLSEMKRFLETGFQDIQAGDEKKLQIETARLTARNYNTTHITELEEEFKTLPKSNGLYPQSYPNNGEDMQQNFMTHKALNDLLDEYDLHFVPSMFMLEKALIYLRFIGASRVVMHRVLD